MPRYDYRAVDAQGRIVRGELEAAGAADLERRLAGMGLDLLRARRAAAGFGRTRRVPPRELIVFTRQLQQLVRAGVPLADAIGDLRDALAPGRLKDVLAAVADALASGSRFSQALDEHPAVFGEVYRALVRVGEHSGTLDRVLAELAAMLEWQAALAVKAKRVLTYPAFLFVVVVVVIGFLMVYLVPRLQPFLALAGSELPGHTRALIALAEFFTAHGWWLPAVPLAAGLALGLLRRRHPPLARRLDGAVLRLPLFGPLLQRIALARFCNAFALMYGAGLTVLDALDIGGGLLGNRALAGAVAEARERIAEGAGIAEAFAAAGVFPPLVVRMLRVGETTGDLTPALLNVAAFLSEEVDATIGRLEPALMPALTVLLGGLVAWIMLSIMGPVYDAVVKLSLLGI